MVITGGLALAFVLTLFVTPVIYLLIEGLWPSKHKGKPGQEGGPVPAE